MKRTVILACLMLVWCPVSVFAFDKNITCESPQGTRVDYFLKNPTNIPNEAFHMSRDRVSGMQPHFEFKEGEVVFKIVMSSSSSTETMETTMKILDENDDEITFTGVVNGAPIMASYYPQMKILIYTQQSLWPSPDFQGARALIMYAKCTEDAPAAETPAADQPATSENSTM